MALILKDRVKETTSTTGTGAFTLTGAATGFQTFSAAIGNGNTTFYAAWDGLGNWETGLGTYSSSGNTLARTTVLSSSNGGSAVNFPNTPTVWCDMPASQIVYNGGSITNTIALPDNATWSSSGIRSLTSFVVGASSVGPAQWLNQITSNGTVTSHLAFKDTSPSNGDALIGFFDNSNVIRGSIAWNGTTAVQYNTTSDARLKTLTGAINSGDMFDAVSPHAFIWNEDNSADHGFVAQELHTIVPRAVCVGSPASVKPTDPGFKPWQVDYSKLVPILWAEIQSLRARLKAANIP